MEETQSSRTGIFPVHPKAFWALVPVIAGYVWQATIYPEGALAILSAQLVGLGLFLLLLTWVVFLISRGSVRAASWTFCIVCGLTLVGHLLRMRHNGPRADWRTLMSESGRVAEQLMRRAENDLDGTSKQPLSMGEYYARLSGSFRDLSDRLEGDAGRAASAMAAVTGDYGEIGTLYDDATRNLMERHPLDYSKLRSSAEVQDRIRLLDRGLETCRRLIQASRELPDRLRAKLRDAGMPAQDSTEVAGMLTGGGDHQFAAEVREFDLKMLSAMRKMMVLLNENWGSWYWNAETERLESGSDELLSGLQTLVDEHNAAVEEQQAAQRLAFSKLRRGLKRAAQ